MLIDRNKIKYGFKLLEIKDTEIAEIVTNSIERIHKNIFKFDNKY